MKNYSANLPKIIADAKALYRKADEDKRQAFRLALNEIIGQALLEIESQARDAVSRSPKSISHLI